MQIVYAQAVPESYANNPTSVQWVQTQTPHFKIVFPERYTQRWSNIGGLAEEIYAEFKRVLGTAPDGKIALYFNDEDEVISGIRALGTDESKSLWSENAYRQNIDPAQQNLRDALRYEIAIAFQEEIQYFPIDYYFYLFSNPKQHPWSDGMPAYLTVPQNTHYDTRWMRNYWFTQLEETSQVYRYQQSTNIILGRSQIRFFNQTFSPDSLRPMYTFRQTLGGLIDYYNFEPAFLKASGIEYDHFYSRWEENEQENYRREKSQVDANRKGEAYSSLDQQEKVREYLGIKVHPMSSRIATITLPANGRLLQQLSVLQGSQSKGEITEIGKGFFHPVMAWHPTKNEFVYSRRIFNEKGNYQNELFLSEANGERIRQITENEHAILPSFSPDGRRLAYASTKGGKNRIRIRNMDSGQERVIFTFGSDTTMGRLFWHPNRATLLLSYRGGKGIYNAGILDIENQSFSEFSLQSEVPLNAQWAAGKNRIYLNGIKQKVPNIFTAEISGNALSNIKPVTSVFQGAELWDVISDSTGDTQVLAKTLGTYRRGMVTAYSGTPLKTSESSDAAFFSEKKDSLKKNTNVKVVPEPSSNNSIKPYNSFLNLKWEPPFPVPYYLSSGDFGLAGYASLYEPLRNHEFGFTGILSLAAPFKSYFYSSYTNNTFKPRLELSYNHFPSASDWFGNSQEVETTDVIALSSLWKINALSRGYSNWYFGLLLRHQAFDYFSEATLRRHHPEVFFDNRLTRQTDLRLSLAWRVLKPYRHTLIHPLDGTGVRLLVTGSDKVLGSQTQYTRFSLEGYTVLPAGGNNRIFLYGNGAFDAGEPAGRDYLAFTDNGNYNLPDADFTGSINPGLNRFVRGYSTTVLGERFLFGTAEYRVPLQLDSSKKLFGFIPPARMAVALFLDGGVLGDARTGTNTTRTEYRSSVGAEVKRVFSFGGSFKFTYELGIAQPLDQALSPDPYFNVKAAIPF